MKKATNRIVMNSAEIEISSAKCGGQGSFIDSDIHFHFQSTHSALGSSSNDEYILYTCLL